MMSQGIYDVSDTNKAFMMAAILIKYVIKTDGEKNRSTRF